ncbi:MAG: DUF1499 domain-containing protein [Rhodobacterales bacterium]|nr:DUF1499 domain-containing protein [Rhodobacterales bacterium]NCT12609.1 DUF1499 domain-containing protein [Rhodobacterales bacterium]
MKRVVRGMIYTLAALVGIFVVLTLIVRLSPLDVARWHVAPVVVEGSPADTVVAQRGGATLLLSSAMGTPEAVLARLDTIALATPRTIRIAGSVEEGRITWQTRSLIWGFPDYTTAEMRDDGLYLWARQRLGTEDLGVNAARLNAWLAALRGS